MKDIDTKMRDRHWQREVKRLQRMAEKQLREEKESYRARTDKDEQEAEMIQRLISIAKRRL